ncbi:PREDICTED: uncharacterized protein LOC104790932 [Camelina sativa]|uniref:Uncharacterized protein LOC104790932 n=1 Tax=Camelina sativa TaxID=90675 RepID=A0ABM0ZFI7_CAMSA|nr:PREDICTED: uncharacterized protein LOC104790932 [Camelina sativa]
MVSSLLSFAPATVRVYATGAKGASGPAKEEKNPIDFVLGFMTKQDQFYETDPILQKVEEKQASRSSGTASGKGGSRSSGSTSGKGATKSSGTTSGRGSVRGGKNSAPTPVAPKKNEGGFGGLGGLFKK